MQQLMYSVETLSTEDVHDKSDGATQNKTSYLARIDHHLR